MMPGKVYLQACRTIQTRDERNTFAVKHRSVRGLGALKPWFMMMIMMNIISKVLIRLLFAG